MCIVDNMPRRRLRDLNIIQIPPNLKETNSEHQTAIRSLNVLNTADEPTEIQSNVNFNLHACWFLLLVFVSNSYIIIYNFFS